MTRETRSEVVENEWFHVRYSGETPEIALHSSFYYLTEAPSGPGIILDEEETSYLLEAAKERYCEIVYRDILPENRDATIYRGVLRSICNWRRFKRFCGRYDLDSDSYRPKVAETLIFFLRTEIDDIEKGHRQGCINCSHEELHSFSLELGCDLEQIHDNIAKYCRKNP